uniref:Uncharacterized protein n=1 Tax=Glossina austeni TaxID=7395 RepID=A0A1A9UF58_GLOAU
MQYSQGNTEPHSNDIVICLVNIEVISDRVTGLSQKPIEVTLEDLYFAHVSLHSPITSRLRAFRDWLHCSQILLWKAKPEQRKCAMHFRRLAYGNFSVQVAVFMPNLGPDLFYYPISNTSPVS